MKEIKVILIALEIAMIVGMSMILFLTDWTTREDLILLKILIVILAMFAVLFQKEQGEIKWEYKE